MKQASLIIGIIAIVGMLIGFIPCLGWFNWLNIPIAVVGLILGLIAYNDNRNAMRAQEYNPEIRVDNAMPLGVILCGIAVIFGFIRLVIGFGIF